MFLWEESPIISYDGCKEVLINWKQKGNIRTNAPGLLSYASMPLLVGFVTSMRSYVSNEVLFSLGL